jgi:DNA polymerase-3 subunit delta'
VEPDAGRRGITIEQVRQLEHAAALRPYESRRKVFVVAGVEAMSDAAANALLKTLEEPPADTVLILTTGDVSRVLPTIVSRCREVALRPVPAPAIERALCAGGAEPGQARLLARLAAGRPGWALAALADPEQVLARTRQVERLEGLLVQRPRRRLPAAAEFGEPAAAKDVLDVWLGWWRDALLVQQDLSDLVVNADRLESLRRLGAAHPPAAVWGALRRIQEAREQVDANANVRLAVEALLLDLPESQAP